MSRLYEIGQALQDAQRELAGDRLRELAAERRQVISELMPEASRVAAAAGVSASGSTLDEVRATLEAALADAGAREAVRAGQLTRPISYAGLGEVDLAAALTAPRPVKVKMAEPEEDGAEQAMAEVQAAEQAAESAARDLAAAESRSTGLDEQRQFLARRVAHLQAELGRAESEDRELAKATREAKRSQDAAAKALAQAQRALTHARRRADSG
jgi:hypothetical protein